jgi:hypothetical protein
VHSSFDFYIQLISCSSSVSASYACVTRSEVDTLTRLLSSGVERPHMTPLSKSGLTNEFLPKRSQRLVDPAGPSSPSADKFRQVALFSRCLDFPLLALMPVSTSNGPLLERRSFQFFAEAKDGKVLESDEPFPRDVWSFNVRALPGSFPVLKNALEDIKPGYDSKLLSSLTQQLVRLNDWHKLSQSGQLDEDAATWTQWNLGSEEPSDPRWSRSDGVHQHILDFEAEALASVLSD